MTAGLAPSTAHADPVAARDPYARLRIVHLLNELAQAGNGIVNVAIDLAVDQARAGHDVTVVAPSGAYLELLRANGVKHLSMRTFSIFRPLNGAMALRDLVRRTQPHIVHAHMMTGALVGRLACTGTSTTMVTTVHNSWQRHAVLMRFGHRVIAVSDAVRDDMIRRGVPAPRIETVLNGTIGTLRKPAGTAPAPLTLRHPNLVTVAGMFERKGIADLIEAAALIRERVPGITAYLVGDGPDRAAFEQLAKDRGIADSVVFLGFRADAEAVMRQADVFVLASHADSNPLVIPEARAAGLPIVATRVDGIPESLDGGAAGLLVPAHAPDALANAVVGLLLDSAQRERLRAAASRNLERLTVHRMACETISVYKRAMEERVRGGMTEPRELVAAPHAVRNQPRIKPRELQPLAPRRMKLAVIANRVFRRGGMERASAEVFSRIAGTDDVTIIATECELEQTRHLRWLPVRAIRRPAMLNQAMFARSAQALERAEKYDLIVSVDSAAREADVVIAHFCLGMFTSRFSGLRGGSNRLRRIYQRIAERSLTLNESRLYKSSRLRGVIAVSSGLKRELMEQYGIADSMIRVIPNGVDRTVFHPAPSIEAKLALRRELGLSETAFLAVFVGGDWDRKGLADVIRAIAKLPGTELVVVGGGNAAAFGRIAESLGAGARVHFAGIQSQPQRYLAAGDVFACPSRYETFSMSGLEAAACGLPLVVVRTNGLEDFVEHGVNGFFVETNVESVREALERLMGDAALRESMSKAALRTAARFDWGDIATATREELESLAREPVR